MAAGGTPGNVHLGAGRLWVAPIGTTEPVNASSALPSAWRAVGYTEDGTTVTLDMTNEEIEVAEEYEPILYVMTKRTTMVSVQMAEATKANLALALGLGAAVANDSAYVEPPIPGAEIGFMLVWDSQETAAGNADNKRWIFRQCKIAGSVEMSTNKAPAKKLIPVEINVEKPTGLAPWRAFPNASGRI